MRMKQLQPRMRQLARLTKLGMSCAEQAIELGISKNTVKSLRSEMFKRLGVSNEVELASILLLPLDSPLNPINRTYGTTATINETGTVMHYCNTCQRILLMKVSEWYDYTNKVELCCPKCHNVCVTEIMK